MHTTLNKIRKHAPCTDGWEKLLKTLGKTKADDEPLSLITILDSNGLDDALWCLQAVEGYDREMRLLAVRYARQVKNLMKDKRSLKALDVAERFANGQATQQELEAACDAARDAASSAAWAAARSAAGFAASAAAWAAIAAARAAAANVAKAAAWDAACDAAGDSARDAARSAQETMFREMFAKKSGAIRMTNKQCASCGGFCKKSGCERLNENKNA